MNRRWIFYAVNIGVLTVILATGFFVYAFKNNLMWFKDIEEQQGEASTSQVDCADSSKVMTLDEFKTALASGKIATNLNSSGALATAVINNQTACTAPLVLNSYKMYNDNIAEQTIFAETQETMRPSSLTTMTVSLPDCKAQVDLFYYVPGSILTQSTFPDHQIAWDYGNNSNNFCTSDNAKPNVSMIKSGPASTVLEAELTYIIQITNSGTGPANDIFVKDIFPNYLIFLGAAQEYCQLTGQGMVECPVGDVPAGSNRNLELTFKVVSLPPCGEAIYNQAELTSSNHSTLNQTVGTEVNNCTPPPPPPVTDGKCSLSIVKSVDALSAIPGQQINYVIKLKNIGTADCTGKGVKVEDTYSPYVKFISETHSSNVLAGYQDPSTPVHQETTRLLTWNAQVLKPGATAELGYKAEVKALPACSEVSINNTARTTSLEYESMQKWVNSNTVVTSVKTNCDETPTSLDLKITKTVAPTLITVGGQAVFSIMVSNLSAQKAHSVTVKDVLPSGLEYLVHSASGGGYAPGTGIWTLGDLDLNGTATLTISVEGVTTGTKLNKAEIVSVVETDTNPANNKAEASVTVVAPENPPVACSPNSQEILLGSKAVFSGTGGNQSFSWQANGGTPSSGSGSFFETVYSSIGEKTVVVSSDGKTKTCVVNVKQPISSLDLQVEKKVSPNLVLVGSNATFTVTVRNLTTVNATNIKLKDIFPKELSLQSYSSNSGNYNTTTGEWLLSSLTAGGSSTLTLVAKSMQPGLFTNYVELVTSTPLDINVSNNYASASLAVQSQTVVGDPSLYCLADSNNISINSLHKVTAVGGNGSWFWTGPTVSPSTASGSEYDFTALSSGLHTLTVISGTQTARCQVFAQVPPSVGLSADLMLLKTVEQKTVTVGSEATFILTLENQGPGSSDNISVKDSLPVGLKFVRALVSKGSFSADTGHWQVGQLIPGEKVTLILVTKAEKIGRNINQAEVWTASATDPDSVPANGVTSEDDFAMAELSVNAALAQAGLPLLPTMGLSLGLVLVGFWLLWQKRKEQVALSLPQGVVKINMDND